MDDLKQSISDLSDLFGATMASFQDKLTKGAASVSPITSTGLQLDFNAFQSFVVLALTTLQRQVELLSRDMDAMEMRSRRKMLLIHGIPESDKEDTSATVVGALAKQDLNVGLNDIGRSQRMGRPIKGKARPVLVKFCSLEARKKGWFGKKKLKGSGVTISEFLTKPRHDAFMDARKVFGISKCWTMDGTIFILTPDGVRHKVHTSAEVRVLAAGVHVSPVQSAPAAPVPSGQGEPAASAPAVQVAPVESTATEQRDVAKLSLNRPKRKAASDK